MVLIISPLYHSSFDNNLLILTQGSNRVTREHSSVTLWLPGFSQKTSNSLMFLGPVDSSSCYSSSSRVATEGRKGLRGHSGDFMATPASSIDLKQSFRVSEKTLSTLSLSLVCLFVCLFVYFISLGVFHGFLNRPQPSVPRIREISEILSALSFSGISRLLLTIKAN